jgi:parallel beta-helix repeat protein
MNVRLHEFIVSCVLLAPAASLAVTTSPSVSGCNTTPSIPSIPKGAVTFKRTSAPDQYQDLQTALGKLHEGDWLVLEPGTYPISHHLTIEKTGISLYGSGATLQSTSPTDGAIVIRADKVAVYKLTMNQTNEVRQTTPWAGGISVYDDRGGSKRMVDSPLIVGNTINNSAGSGIFLYKASRFTVAGNTVYRSLADGIHATAGSTNGRIIQNKVRQTGDDMIAIVSYAGKPHVTTALARFSGTTDASLDRNIYVAENDVSDQYWGRGISVVGGADVTIENNSISKNPGAAGIYLLRETSYVTFGDRNILVRNNRISEIQTQPATYVPAGIKIVLSHHGAIEVASQTDSDEWSNNTFRSWLAVSGIEITGNTIHNARFGGIRLGANSSVNNTLSDVNVHDNTLSSVGAKSIAAIYPGLDRNTLSCAQNSIDGTTVKSGCDSSGGANGKSRVSVTGASLSCRADGSVVSTGPNPPTSISIQ